MMMLDRARSEHFCHGATWTPVAVAKASCLAVMLFAVAGCAPGVAKEIDLVGQPRTFSFAKPVSTAQGVLPPGEYFCQYTDESGYFCEAPASLNEAYLFSGGASGGLHISRGTPRIVRLFTQDKHPTTFYTPQLGMFTSGGSGLFRLADVLHAPEFDHINIQGE